MVELTGTSRFRLAASKLQNITLQLNKDSMRILRLEEKAYKESKKLLGGVFDDLTDIYKQRAALVRLLGNYVYLLDNKWTSALDPTHERMLLVYHKFISSTPEQRLKDRVPESTTVDTVTGLLYAFAASQIDTEFANIKKASNRSILSPAFDLNPKTYKWKRCPEVTRKYNLFYTKPEGYNVYYYEYPNFATICFLNTLGLSDSMAESTLGSGNCGMLYNFLPLWIENSMLDEVLGDDTTRMRGDLVDVYKLFLHNFSKIAENLGERKASVFENCVQPIMIEKLGRVMISVDNLVQRRFLKSEKDFYFYHVSPYRFGVAIKDTVNIEDVLPGFGSGWMEHFYTVTEPKLGELIFGVYV